jgi:hypothetical protein
MCKYRKEYKGDFIYFKICNENFITRKIKKAKDTCLIKAINNLKLVDLEYINEKKAKNILRYNPFKKIFIVEKLSKDKIIKHEVTWVDNWIMTDD